jgi:MFS family permease
MISFARYHEFFAVPGVRAMVSSSIAGRMPIGIAGLAILLFVQAYADSFALAGTAAALYVLGLGLIAPFLGRLIDRFGPRPVLAVCALLYPAALAGLAVLVLTAASPAAIGVAAVLAGATLPPITACTRALYPRLIADPALLHTAYSIDSALVEVVFIVGPALVAACVALDHAEAAVLLAALSAAAGTVLFLRAPAVRGWTASLPRARDWAGALRYRALLVLYGTTLLYAFAFGLFEIAVTAHASAKDEPAAAGIALALASLGSGAGAVVYGSRHWNTALDRQFVAALVAMAAGMLLLVPIDDLVLYSAMSLIAGVPMATVIATQSLLVSRFAPRERLAESFTWSTTCLLVGISGGIAAGGMLAEVVAAYWLLAAAAGSTAVAAITAAACLRGNDAT